MRCVCKFCALCMARDNEQEVAAAINREKKRQECLQPELRGVGRDCALPSLIDSGIGWLRSHEERRWLFEEPTQSRTSLSKL